MTYGVDQFIFVDWTGQRMYYNTTGTALSPSDQYLVSASDGLLGYFSMMGTNTVEDIRDCYDGAWYINTSPTGTGGPYNG